MKKKKPFTARESVQQALGKLATDFRSWMIPETSALSRWKTQSPAYAVAEGRIIMDVEAKIDSVRKKDLSLPILVVAVEQITSPPELSQVVGTPQEINVILPSDPLQRRVVLRTEPRAYRVQFAFMCSDVDSANSFSSQFCSYIQLIEKRRFKAIYQLSPDLSDEWDVTIFDNSIYPDNADIEEQNMCIGLLDFTVAGLVPRVLKGLPPLYEDEFGVGSGTGGDVNNPKNPNYAGGSSQDGWAVAVEADMFKSRGEAQFKRINADIDTREVTVSDIDKDAE